MSMIIVQAKPGKAVYTARGERIPDTHPVQLPASPELIRALRQGSLLEFELISSTHDLADEDVAPYGEPTQDDAGLPKKPRKTRSKRED